MSYRFLLSRRWLVLTLVAIALVPSMIRLGFWQLHRHQERVGYNELVARSLAVKPVPVERLTRPGADIPEKRTWRAVTATGRYDTRHEVVARQRTAADQRVGYHVVTPLVLPDGRALLVNRGWIPTGDDITVLPEIPKAPPGEVTVTGRLRPDETAVNSGIRDRSGLPERQVMLINSRHLARSVPEPLLGGYVELTGTSPRPPGPQPEEIPAPDHDSIGPHMAYALQWWLFAAMVPVGWVVLARRERTELLAAAAGSGTAAHPGVEPGPRPDTGPGADPAARVPSAAAARPTGPGRE